MNELLHKFKLGNDAELLLEKRGGGYEKVATVPIGSQALGVTQSAQGVENLPDPASVSVGAQVYLSNVGVGGSYWYSDGSRWRLWGGSCVLYRLHAPIAGIATTADQLIADARIPAAALKNGDTLRLTIAYGKSGTTDVSIRKLTASAEQGSSSGAVISTTTNAISAANRSYGEKTELVRVSKTVILQPGAGVSNQPFTGTASANPLRSGATVPDMDADWYIGFVNTMSGTTDTPTLQTFVVELITSGA